MDRGYEERDVLVLTGFDMANARKIILSNVSCMKVGTILAAKGSSSSSAGATPTSNHCFSPKTTSPLSKKSPPTIGTTYTPYRL